MVEIIAALVNSFTGSPDVIMAKYRFSLLSSFMVALLSFSTFAAFAAPTNDDFANAQVLTLPYSGTTTAMNTATIEAGEPVHGCRKFGPHTGTNSVWFTFTLPVSGVVQVSTEGSNFIPDHNSLLSIYTGDSLVNLVEVGCHDDLSDQNQYSALDIFLPAATYYLKISNWSSVTPLNPGATLQLSVSFTPGITPSVTPTSSITPTATPTPSMTPAVTLTSTSSAATATPTMTLQPGIELIVNGDFEINVDGDKVPDQWQGNGLTQDKQICNKPDKVVAYSGLCAFQFKGSPGEKSELRQFSLIAGVPAASLLTLTIAANTKIDQPLKLVIVKLNYQEADTGQNQNGKDKLKLKLSAPTTGYRSFNTVLIADGTPVDILVRLPFKQLTGKIRLDALSLTATFP